MPSGSKRLYRLTRWGGIALLVPPGLWPHFNQRIAANEGRRDGLCPLPACQSRI